MKTISVKTEGGHYQILIGHGIIGQLGRKCKGLKLGRQVVIVADESVGKLYAESISKVLVSEGFCDVYVSSLPNKFQT